MGQVLIFDIRNLWNHTCGTAWGHFFLRTSFGCSLLFFGLNVLVILWGLRTVQNYLARKNWGPMAWCVGRMTLLLPGAIEVAAKRQLWVYAIGYTDEVLGSITLVGGGLPAFSKLSKAMQNIAPIALRLRRRLALLDSETLAVSPEERQRIDSRFSRELDELRIEVTRHRTVLEYFARKDRMYAKRKTSDAHALDESQEAAGS